MPQQRTTFSVVIPTHNRATLTARAVDSVLANRSCGRVEVLVVDDGSNDGSADRLEARYAAAPRVRLLTLPGNRGPSAARNLGMRHARGEFVLFFDSDDILFPHSLAFAMEAFQQAPEMQILAIEGHSVNVHDGAREERIQQEHNRGWGHLRGWPGRTVQVPAPEGSRAPPASLQVGDSSQAILRDDMFFLSGVVLRRQAVHGAGLFNERFRFLEDWDFMVRACQCGPTGYLAHTGFRRETGRADQLGPTGNSWQRTAMHQRVLDTVRASRGAADGQARKPLRRAQAAADYLLGRKLLLQRRYHPARRRFARAATHGFKPLKSLVWVVGSLLAPGLIHGRLGNDTPPFPQAGMSSAK